MLIKFIHRRIIPGALILISLTFPCHAEVRLLEAMGRPQIRIMPAFRYDPNINGGQPKSSFQIGGLQFIIPPSEVAQSGLLAGAAFSLGGLSEFGNNLGVQYRFNYQALTDERLNYGQQKTEVSVCALSFLTERNLISACASSFDEQKELSGSSLASFELKSESRKPLMLVGLPQGNWETSIAFAVARDRVDGRWRNRGVSSLGLYRSGGQSAHISVSLYEPIPDMISDRYQVIAELENQKYRFSGVILTYTLADGGNFFGLDRHEATTRIGVNFRMYSNFTAGIGYSHKDSSVDFYDEDGSIDLVVKSIEF